MKPCDIFEAKNARVMFLYCVIKHAIYNVVIFSQKQTLTNKFLTLAPCVLFLHIQRKPYARNLIILTSKHVKCDVILC